MLLREKLSLFTSMTASCILISFFNHSLPSQFFLLVEVCAFFVSLIEKAERLFKNILRLEYFL